MRRKSLSKEPIDFFLLIIVMIMLATGLIMVMSASSPAALSETGDSYHYVKRQAICAVAGICLMILISKIDYRKYKNHYKKIYWASLILVGLVIFMGKEVSGAKRWMSIAGITFQPSEVAKVGIIFFYAQYLTINKEKLGNMKEGFIIPLLYLIPFAIIIFVFQNHLSATLLIIMIVSIMMLMSGTKLRYFLTYGLIGGGFFGLGYFAYAKITGNGLFRLARLATFLHPFDDLQGSGWQIAQSLYAIGSGGLFGVGLGNSTQKYLYLPEAHNDFIFSIIAEELGFVGCVFVIILFVLFIWRGIVIAVKSKDMYGSLLACGITTMVGLQAIINIAVVTSSMPNTGMPLPFFSYGGTSLIILLASIGVLLNISRSKRNANT